MPAGSEKLTAARREEILDACAQLYEIMPFKKITHAMISQKTSFTRTSIYNYFRTKEEIFLALLEREYAEWVADLNALAALDMPREEFPPAFSALLEKRKCMLKLMSMNLYDIESGSSLQSLVSFKRVYNNSMLGVRDCLKKHCPDMSDNRIEKFIYEFYPFLFGVYPYTNATQKQQEAMANAGVEYKRLTIAEITLSLVDDLLGAKQH